MRSVSITASGYTWTCPECGGENYLGAAPRQVACGRCQAAFDVADRLHRLAESKEAQIRLFDVGGEDRQEMGKMDEIPF